MDNRPNARITFAIPFYSTPEFLDAAIRSVLAQTITDWELIVVDDRSPVAGIKEQVHGYGDARIRYHLNEKNLGQSGNFNQGLTLAQTEMVTLLHADDQLHPKYGETMLKAASEHHECWALFCNADIIDGQGKKIFSFIDFYKRFLVPSRKSTYTLVGEQGLRSLIPGNFIMAPTLCFRKAKLGTLRFSSDWKCSPDLDFTSRLLFAGGTLVGVPDVAFSYRRHEASATIEFRRSISQFEEEVRLYNYIAIQSAAICWETAAREASNKRIVKLRLAYFGIQDPLQLRVKHSLHKLSFALKLLLSPNRERPASV